jgi:hypothetical protein
MLEIFISTSLISEFNFVSKFIFGSYLGLPYKITFINCLDNIILKIDDQSDISLTGDFWHLKNYRSISNIPDKISFLRNDFTENLDLPIIFGNPEFKIEGKHISLGADIFASAYFMLSRWEESVIPTRDNHLRFPGTESLAFKNNFLNRPLVEEYCELLWRLMGLLGYNEQRVDQVYHIVPTHDIDQFRFWKPGVKNELLRNIGGDIFKRRNLSLSISRTLSYLNTISGGNDPGDTFDYLMDKAERIGAQALFYFIAGGQTIYDNDYSISSSDLEKILIKIRKRGHFTGIHPSYDSFRNPELLINEIANLREITNSVISEGRNHYLRFEIPASYHVLQQAGLKTDSTLYYPGLPGFRCGTCHEFPVFDFISRKELQLIERPLIVMDTSFRNGKPEKVYSQIISLKETVKKFKGNFVFLWHNSNIDTPEWKPLKKTFEKAFYGD